MSSQHAVMQEIRDSLLNNRTLPKTELIISLIDFLFDTIKKLESALTVDNERLREQRQNERCSSCAHHTGDPYSYCLHPEIEDYLQHDDCGRPPTVKAKFGCFLWEEVE